ncbi:hypothetical protein [Serratia fonticola]|uniref:hypothetical protein n=2 Tax=Serratia fonticola TaxID=47917 RepID=UPI00211B8475|nr:hypothetical protein [Serratia fonticola]
MLAKSPPKKPYHLNNIVIFEVHMLYVDIPSREEYAYLADIHADACISIYLETWPLRQHLEASKIQLGNFIKEALLQVADSGLDKRRVVLLEEQLRSVLEDESFWD